MDDVEHAIILLRNSGIPVEKQAYGFCLKHKDLTEHDFAQCGMDNDGSISMSVNVDETPPVTWFFRMSFVEMAEFIIDAYDGIKNTKLTRNNIVKSMRELDENYDDTELDRMIAKIMGRLQSDEGL